MYKIYMQSNKANALCKQGPRFQWEPDHGRSGHFRDTEMCKTLIQYCVPFQYSKGAVRTVRIFKRKLLILYWKHNQIILVIFKVYF